MNKILLLAPRQAHTSLRLVEAAHKLGLELDVLETRDIVFVASHDKTGLFYNGRDLVAAYDALIVRDFHPYISEALTVARLFADAGKVVVDKSLTDEGYSISKMNDYLLLGIAGVPVPETHQIYDHAGLKATADKLGYPCVLKGTHGSHGNHVFKINLPSQIDDLIQKYPEGQLLLQEYLPADFDYRVITIGYKAVPKIVKRQPANGDFRTNFELTADWESLDVKDYPELVRLAENSARILRREFSAVDIRYRGDKPYVLEANRKPGFEGFEETTGLDVAELFLKNLVSKTTVNSRSSA